MAAKLDTDWQLDETRARRSTARQRLEQWEAAHPLRMWAAKAAGSEDGKPMEWRALHQEAAALDRRVQEIKGSRRQHQAHLDAFDQEAVVLKKQKAEGEGRLAEAFDRIQSASRALANSLMVAVTQEEKAQIVAVRPEQAPPPIPLAQEAPVPRLRATPRLAG